jgi:hypothetical protein
VEIEFSFARKWAYKASIKSWQTFPITLSHPELAFENRFSTSS